MVELFHAGKPVDLITLQEYLKEKDVPPEISSMEFARDLLMGTQTSANIKSYAEIVREKSIMRRLIKVNEETANACYLQNQPLEEIRKMHRSRFCTCRDWKFRRVCTDQAGCTQCIGCNRACV